MYFDEFQDKILVVFKKANFGVEDYEILDYLEPWYARLLHYFFWYYFT